MSDSGIVYSTTSGRMCPDCGQPVAKCTCKRNTVRASGDGIVRVRREVKGRKGKTVTIISGVPLNDDELKEFAKRLKQMCGSGGSVKDGDVIIQGDQCQRIIAEIKKIGYPVKRAGG